MNLNTVLYPLATAAGAVAGEFVSNKAANSLPSFNSSPFIAPVALFALGHLVKSQLSGNAAALGTGMQVAGALKAIGTFTGGGSGSPYAGLDTSF
jgi:hypothetical protein